MDNLLDALNDQQKAAVTAIDCPVRIIAGAGSGKTRVLMARIEYLISQIGIMPYKICAITFTNKAANEMKERLAKRLGDQSKSVRISTIHALALRMLSEDAKAAGYPKGIRVLDGEDQKAIVRQAAKKLDITLGKGDSARFLSFISDFKMAGIPPEKAADYSAERDAVFMYEEYEKRKKELESLDFDDLLIKARDLLKNNEEVLSKWQRRMEYLHVDEFQDVDHVQYEIIKLLTGKDTILCVVGDPDQTIYTWRGADVDIIMQFEKDFPGTKTIFLTQNYRSSEPVLYAANGLIAYNRNREKKDLIANRKEEVPIVKIEAEDADTEGIKAARTILDLRKKGVPYHEMAILYRNNYLSRSFEKALRLAKIPYRIFGGVRYYERKEVKDMLSYLRLIASDKPDKANDLAIERILNVPRRGIGQATLNKLRLQADMENTSLQEAMENPVCLTAPYAKKIKAFLDNLEEIKAEVSKADWEDIISVAASISGMSKELDENQEKERLENVYELQQDLNKAKKEDPEITLSKYLDNISLFTDRMQEDREDSVSLMTIHAAKGTEFDAVIVGGVNENILPASRSATSQAALEEERRLMYVAMTRARVYLTISWNRGLDFTSHMSKMPSRFIDEIPLTKEEEDKLNDLLAQFKSKVRMDVKMGAARPSKKALQKPLKLRAGMKVDHDMFGEGFVRSVAGGIATIEFEPEIGVKKIKADHESLHKIG